MHSNVSSFPKNVFLLSFDKKIPLPPPPQKMWTAMYLPLAL